MNYQVRSIQSRLTLFTSSVQDPVPALEYAQALQKRSEKVSDLEVENQKLRETLGKFIEGFPYA